MPVLTTFTNGARNPREPIMADAILHSSADSLSDTPAPIPFAEILPWAVFAGLLLLLALYFVGAEQGATAIFSGTLVHEFVHDGRHLLGFPCH